MLTFHSTKKRSLDAATKWRFRKLLRLPRLVHLKFARRKKTTLVVIGLGLFLLGISLYTVIEKPYQVNQILCTKDQNFCPTELEANFGIFKNQNLLALETEPVIVSLMIKHPEIKSIVAKKRFPGTISIIITSRQAIAWVENQLGLRYAIDTENKVFSLVTTNNLPVIKTDEAVAVGDTVVSSSIVGSVKLIQILTQSAVAIQSLTLDGSGTIEVLLSSGVIAQLSDEKDLIKQVDTLQYILGESSGSKTKITTIDLRFDNPVVK